MGNQDSWASKLVHTQDPHWQQARRTLLNSARAFVGKQAHASRVAGWPRDGTKASSLQKTGWKIRCRSEFSMSKVWFAEWPGRVVQFNALYTSISAGWPGSVVFSALYRSISAEWPGSSTRCTALLPRKTKQTSETREK